jgi:hypothetical protein
MTIMKRLASLFFGLAFLMALNLFADVGREWISTSLARTLFIAFGAVALVLNLLSFQGGKNSPVFNFLYWAGTIIAFVGLVFQQFHLPYGMYILIAGMIVLGISLVLPESLARSENEKRDDLIDDL